MKTVYKTDDGKIFDSKELAEAHELFLKDAKTCDVVSWDLKLLSENQRSIRRAIVKLGDEISRLVRWHDSVGVELKLRLMAELQRQHEKNRSKILACEFAKYNI